MKLKKNMKDLAKEILKYIYIKNHNVEHMYLKLKFYIKENNQKLFFKCKLE